MIGPIHPIAHYHLTDQTLSFIMVMNRNPTSKATYQSENTVEQDTEANNGSRNHSQSREVPSSRL